jgi:hypothetical protein
MWWTPEGARVLHGAEWALFREALADLVASIREEDDVGDGWTTGVRAFDELGRGQRLALLAMAGRALRDEAAPMPELTACLEASIAAVYAHALALVEEEIDFDDARGPAADRTAWRRLILAAWDDVGDGLHDDDPEETSADLETWEILVDALRDHILWDADYDIGDVFLDADPALARAWMARMHIADDYYTAIPPDPTDAQLVKVLRTLRELGVGG